MSHIHLPDGILPPWLWILGSLIIVIYFAIFSKFNKKFGTERKIALLGLMSALMLVAMSIEIIPPAYHMNLAALTGIILGPALSVVAVFIVNLLLVFLGHGGLTTIGLNTIAISSEAIICYFLFRFFTRKPQKFFIKTFVSTFIALFISAWISLGIVYLGTKDNSYFFEHKHEHNEKVLSHNEENHLQEEHLKTEFDIKKFILIILSLGSLGWIAESLITAFIVEYIRKIKPEILDNF